MTNFTLGGEEKPHDPIPMPGNNPSKPEKQPEEVPFEDDRPQPFPEKS